MEKIVREGDSVDDPLFAQKNRTWQKLYSDRVASFTAFDANLNDAYGTNWMNAIIKFEKHPPDESMHDDVAIQTEKLQQQQDLAFQAMDDLEYYAKRAFPNDERTMNEFGFMKTRKQRDSGMARLGVSLMTAKRVGADYTAELTAVGMPATVLSNLEAQAVALFQQELEQEYTKRLRLRATKHRINFYNTLRGFYIRVRDAARIVFRAQPETRDMWEL